MRKFTIISVLFMLPLIASAFNGKAKVGGIWYNIVTKAEKAEVTKPDVGSYSGIVRIPSKIVYEGVTCKVTAIGDGAFAYGTMTSVTIPNTVTKIDVVAFRWCQNLKNITIPNSVKEIGASAFEGCISLSSVTLSQELKKIENSVFKGCKSLKVITIPGGVNNIDMYAFSGCTNLSSATLNNGLDSISSEAFSSCGLRSIVVPNSVRIIGSNAFRECKSLASITLGNGVEKISHGAFEKCGDLKEFYITKSILPDIINHAEIFRGSEVEYATLYVPESAIVDFKAIAPWSNFGKIVANPNIKAEDIKMSTEMVDNTIYELKDCQGELPIPPMKRYEFQEWFDQNIKYPEEAKAKRISGSVTVDFVIEADGSISNVKAEAYKPELVAEAERVVKSMPKWKPGKVNGKFARVKDRIAVYFNLP